MLLRNGFETILCMLFGKKEIYLFELCYRGILIKIFYCHKNVTVMKVLRNDFMKKKLSNEILLCQAVLFNFFGNDYNYTIVIIFFIGIIFKQFIEK